MSLFSRILYISMIMYAVYQKSLYVYCWVFLFLVAFIASDFIEAYRERTKKNAKAIRDSAPTITIYPPSDSTTPQ